MTVPEVDVRRADDAVAAVAVFLRATLRLVAGYWVLTCVAAVAVGVVWGFPSGWGRVALGAVAMLPPLVVLTLRALSARRRIRYLWADLGERDRNRISAAGWDPARIGALPPRPRFVAVTGLRLQAHAVPAGVRLLAWQNGGLLVLDAVRIAVHGERWVNLLLSPWGPITLVALLVVGRLVTRRIRRALAALS